MHALILDQRSGGVVVVVVVVRILLLALELASRFLPLWPAAAAPPICCARSERYSANDAGDDGWGWAGLDKGGEGEDGAEEGSGGSGYDEWTFLFYFMMMVVGGAGAGAGWKEKVVCSSSSCCSWVRKVIRLRAKSKVYI